MSKSTRAKFVADSVKQRRRGIPVEEYCRVWSQKLDTSEYGAAVSTIDH